MSEPTLVPLDHIGANPFQPRQGEDPAVVAELAINIHRNGLLQIPSARLAMQAGDERYQLVFGHTRLAAYKLLANFGVPDAGIAPDDRFALMPLYVHELDDRQMFEQGVSENIKRRDLNPVEQARAMQRYMDEFHATSREAAELFGVSDATVRGKVRLLDLPESVQEKMSSGELSEGAGRQLLTLQRINPTKVEYAAEAASNPANSIDDVVYSALHNSENAINMWESWRSNQDAPLAGSDLWPLNLPADQFPQQHLPRLTAKDICTAFGLDHTADLRETLEGWIREIEYDAANVATLLDAHAGETLADGAQHTAPAVDVIERIGYLVDPPACTSCPFYARASRAHYCGAKLCHQRKEKAWAQAELEKLSTDLGIAIYDRERDGKDFVPLLEGWNDKGDKHEKMFKDRNQDLRLRAKGSGQYSDNPYTKSRHVQVIWVGEKALAWKAKKKQAEKEDSWEARNARERVEREQLEARLNRAASFVSEVGLPVFAPILDGIKPAIVPGLFHLADDWRSNRHNVEKPAEDAPQSDWMQYYCRMLVFKLLWQPMMNNYGRDGSLSYRIQHEDNPCRLAAEHLVGVATTLGVKLPVDWLAQADAFDAPVSVETEEAPA
jgi:ParB/RepB/Spo0J family partition protein